MATQMCAKPACPAPGQLVHSSKTKEVWWVSFCQVCTAAILNGIVWLALPQGKDHFGVKVFWLILTSSYLIRLWRDSCPAVIWPSFIIVKYVIRLGWALLGHPTWWHASPADLASTAPGWWRDSCPHPPGFLSLVLLVHQSFYQPVDDLQSLYLYHRQDSEVFLKRKFICKGWFNPIIFSLFQLCVNAVQYP